MAVVAATSSRRSRRRNAASSTAPRRSRRALGNGAYDDARRPGSGAFAGPRRRRRPRTGRNERGHRAHLPAAQKRCTHRRGGRHRSPRHRRRRRHCRECRRGRSRSSRWSTSRCAASCRRALRLRYPYRRTRSACSPTIPRSWRRRPPRRRRVALAHPRRGPTARRPSRRPERRRRSPDCRRSAASSTPRLRPASRRCPRELVLAEHRTAGVRIVVICEAVGAALVVVQSAPGHGRASALEKSCCPCRGP